MGPSLYEMLRAPVALRTTATCVVAPCTALWAAGVAAAPHDVIASATSGMTARDVRVIDVLSLFSAEEEQFDAAVEGLAGRRRIRRDRLRVAVTHRHQAASGDVIALHQVVHDRLGAVLRQDFVVRFAAV